MSISHNFKLSFVIPVYNVEEYINECVDSILKQNHDGCEIILVNDGSKDSSGDICDTYLQHSCIKVIHKENGGPSSARTAGMKIAKGEYIAFVDSDDRIANGAIEKIVRWIDTTNADICFMEATKFFPDGKTMSLSDCIERNRVYGKSKLEVLKYLSTRPKFPGSACTKIYRLAFLKENCIDFPTDRRTAEDLGFSMDCLLKAEVFDALEMPYYEYRQKRIGSITNTIGLKTFWNLALFIEESVNKLTNNEKPKNNISKYAMSFIAYEYFMLLWVYSKIVKLKNTKETEFLRQYQWVMKYSGSIKTKLARVLVSLTGIDISAKVLDYYMTNR